MQGWIKWLNHPSTYVCSYTILVRRANASSRMHKLLIVGSPLVACITQLALILHEELILFLYSHLHITKSANHSQANQLREVVAPMIPPPARAQSNPVPQTFKCLDHSVDGMLSFIVRNGDQMHRRRDCRARSDLRMGSQSTPSMWRPICMRYVTLSSTGHGMFSMKSTSQNMA